MLAYDTVQQLTYRLITVESRAHRRGWTNPPIVLVIVKPQDGDLGDTPLQTITLPMHPRTGAVQDAPLPDLLHGLAAVLHRRAGPSPASAAGRVLLCGVLYHDLHSTLDVICPSRRLEALDVDGRRYEIVRRKDRPYPTVGHGEPGESTAILATRSALTEILTAAGRLLPARSPS